MTLAESTLHEWPRVAGFASLRVPHVRAWFLVQVSLGSGLCLASGILGPGRPSERTLAQWLWSAALYLAAMVLSPSLVGVAKFVMRRDNPVLWARAVTSAAVVSSALSSFAASESDGSRLVRLVAAGILAAIGLACLSQARHAVGWSARGVVADTMGS